MGEIHIFQRGAAGGVPLEELPTSPLDKAIETLLSDGKWRSCTEITFQLALEDGWAVKARLRQERIEKRNVHSRKRSDGIYEYQLEGLAG